MKEGMTFGFEPLQFRRVEASAHNPQPPSTPAHKAEDGKAGGRSGREQSRGKTREKIILTNKKK